GMATIGNQIWAGTDGKGIIILNEAGKILDSIGHTKGLASNIVFTLTATDKYVLAGTQNGLSVINKKTKEIVNYSTLDQLPANEFNSAAAFQRGDTVYLGTIAGVVCFNTGQLKDTKRYTLLQPLYITDLFITDHNGQSRHDYTWPYHQNNTLNIPSRTEYFTIDFGSMGGQTQNLNYYYRLQEDNEWILLGASRKLTFVGMSPGEYQLQLAARLPDGNWTQPLLNLPLIVAAAFYQTIWFKLLTGLLIIGLGWWIFRYRERQKDKERLLRLQIAGDLHDEIGSSLAGISMQADMLLSGHYEHLKEYLQSIADNGRLAVQTMGDIVWSIDPRNDDNVSLFQRMERYGHRVFGSSAISIAFHNEGYNEKQYMPQKVRQNIMLIFKEALTNVVKHADAGQVDVTFIALNKGFRLVIADDGRGYALDPSGQSREGSSGHGLRNIKMRAAAIGADLSFPTVERGAIIVLVLKG
ncbi:MAG TPA: triple tyrosine motif-containing protein, partial [Arachidicoccus sp.]|nr:triple tyrosine motif-containing protein [Arachidicoccus sp.]